MKRWLWWWWLQARTMLYWWWLTRRQKSRRRQNTLMWWKKLLWMQIGACIHYKIKWFSVGKRALNSFIPLANNTSKIFKIITYTSANSFLSHSFQLFFPSVLMFTLYKYFHIYIIYSLYYVHINQYVKAFWKGYWCFILF